MGIYYGSGYDHPFALNQISTHHRIKPPPNTPTGLTASTKDGVKLTWRQNTDGGIYKYMVFRWKQEGIQPNYEFSRLTPATTDTFFNDNPSSGTYKYYVIAVDTNCCESAPSSWATVTIAKGNGGKSVQCATMLLDGSPNPMTGPMTIRYQLSGLTHVSIDIYNSLGQKVRTVVSRREQSGIHSARWDGKDDRGRQAAAGVYFYRLMTGTYVDTRKIVLVR